MSKKIIPPAVLTRKKYVRAEKVSDIRKILDTNPDEETASPEEPALRTRKKRINRRLYFVCGIAVMILSVIGLITVVSFAAGAVKNIIGNTRQKEYFEEILYPLVICDPPPFDEPSELKGDTMVSAACWEIILYGDTDSYRREFDYMIVPEADIEQAAAKLFGEGTAVVHGSVTNSDISFYYSAEKKSYRIPYDPRYFSYTPRVEDISGSKGVYTVETGYLIPNGVRLSKGFPEDEEPEKYMIYTIQKQGSGYAIVSARVSENQPANNSGL